MHTPPTMLFALVWMIALATPLRAGSPPTAVSRPATSRPASSRPAETERRTPTSRRTPEQQAREAVRQVALGIPKDKAALFEQLLGDFLDARDQAIADLEREIASDKPAPDASRSYRNAVAARTKSRRQQIAAIQRGDVIPLPAFGDGESGHGELPAGLKLRVFQIVDEGRMLVRSDAVDRTFLLERPTEGYVDDSPVNLAGTLMTVSGRYEYSTVLGAKATVSVLKPTDPQIVDAVKFVLQDPAVNKYFASPRARLDKLLAEYEAAEEVRSEK